MCWGQIQDWQQIQEVWALQRMDTEKKNPTAPPWCGLMPELMHMRIYIEMEVIFTSFLALLGNPCVLSVNCLHSREMGSAISNEVSLVGDTSVWEMLLWVLVTWH